jgi:ABC-type glycerol-3-phosphate transport system substrate-binding protein
LGYDVTTYNSQFISGKVPMMNNGSYLGARVKTAPNLNDIGVFPWPLPGTSKFVVPSSVIMMFAINKSSNKKAEALALAKWFADPKTGGLFWTKDRGSSPVVKGATFEDPIVKMWAPLYDLPRLDMWHVVQGSAANAELLKSLALLWSKKITPEQIATNLQKAQAEQK